MFLWAQGDFAPVRYSLLKCRQQTWLTGRLISPLWTHICTSLSDSSFLSAFCVCCALNTISGGRFFCSPGHNSGGQRPYCTRHCPFSGIAWLSFFIISRDWAAPPWCVPFFRRFLFAIKLLTSSIRLANPTLGKNAAMHAKLQQSACERFKASDEA